MRHLPLLTVLLCACSSTEKAPEPVPGPEEMAALMEEYAQPAPEALKLEPLVGSWSSKTEFWMVPGQPPVVSTGTGETSWILGGRFLEQRFNGDMMGMPFEGRGWVGWDRVRETYVSQWVDNFGTWMMDPAEGRASKDGTRITFVRKGDSPMGPLVMKEVYRFTAPGEYVLDMYTVADGQETLTMRLTCTRR